MRLLVAGGVLGLAVLASLTLGAAGPGLGDPAVLDARFSRTVVGLAVGASVAVAGAALQGVTRNPLADPGLLGINAGAALAVVLGIQLLGLTSAGQYAWLALLGAAAAAAVVHGVASAARGGARPLTLALAGAAVTALVTSVTGGLLVADQAVLESFRHWQVGSVAGRDPEVLRAVAPLLLPGLMLVLLASRALDSLALGDDLARGLGRRVRLDRAVAVAGAVALSAAATAVAGPIAFVGLVVPHLARLVLGPGPSSRLLLASGLGGGALLVLADTLGRVVAPPTEVQAGIVTAVLGAPALFVLVRRRRVVAL